MFRLTDLFVLFPLALVARVIWAAVRPTARAPFGRVILDALFMTYTVALLEVVLGFTRLGGLGDSFSPWSHVNLFPLGTIGELAHPELLANAIGQVVGNVLLFVPFGVLLPLTATRFRTFRSVLAAGLLLSITIELIQFALLLGRLMDRAADVDDVILNTTGAVLGYAIWVLLLKGSRRQASKQLPAIGDEG